MSDYEINLEDLDEDRRQLAELIGLENFIKLVRNYSGIAVYIPKFDSIMMEARNRRIWDEFDGCNHQFLALKYNLTEVQIRNILRERPGRGVQGHLWQVK